MKNSIYNIIYFYRNNTFQGNLFKVNQIIEFGPVAFGPASELFRSLPRND